MAAHQTTIKQGERIRQDVCIYIDDPVDLPGEYTGKEGYFELPLGQGIEAGECQFDMRDGTQLLVIISNINITNDGYHLRFTVGRRL